ncbi:MAG: FAD-dependent oxidoreductase [Pseudomonadota bacterium]
MKRPEVLIIGGGFAGLACANSLDSRHFEVSLVDARRAFEFLPNIHELISAVKRPADLRLPLHEAMQALGHNFIQGRVSALDPESRCVRIGRRSVQTDYLVLAPGAVDADYGIQGVHEHALGFKSVEELRAIRKRLQAIAGRPTSRVVIIGGGLEGVEGLGEILRAYAGRLRSVALVEAQQRLLPGNRGSVHKHLAKLCAQHGVELHLGDAVQRITAKTVLLSSGVRLRSDATIWTGGPAPPPLLAVAGLARVGEWAPVKTTLEARGFPGVFVAGDASALPSPLRKQAYHAIDMGRCVAANISRHARGARMRRFRPVGKPTLRSFGDIDTLLLTERLGLAGPALAAGKEAVFATVMAGLDRRDARRRGSAVIERGVRASQQLLWPSIRDLGKLRRGTRLKTL